MSRMTLQEKAAQMAQIEHRVVTPAALTDLSIGSVLNASGSLPRDGATAEEWADMVDQMQRDEELAHRIGEVTALEFRASGIPWTFAPCVADCRDPRWGRCFECYSEEPEIVCMVTSIVSGGM